FNRAVIRIVEATQKLEQRTLARAVWTNNRDNLSLGNRHREIIERLATRVRVTERHALEFNPNSHFRFFTLSSIRNHRLHREKLKQVSEKQAVAVKLARVFQQGTHQSLTLIECCQNQRQLAGRDAAHQSSPHHQSECCTNDQQRNQTRR